MPEPTPPIHASSADPASGSIGSSGSSPTNSTRLELGSMDVAAARREELLRLFPEARTEGGKIDFAQLQRALGETIDAGKERYGMNWPGKAACFRTIQQPSMATLRPVPEESVNFDTTENLIIEGDNLEVLKLLQKSYLGKVKMIYIDPPYNTGNDFIYPDNYAESLQTYLEYTGQVDAQGRKFGTNTETDGRFHSRWLNMMYPRLYLARNLLSEDGVIFISLDDSEIVNLRKACDDVFGEEQFIAQIHWRKRSTPPNDKVIGANHDYILIVAKNSLMVNLQLRERACEQLARYRNPDGHPKGEWAAGDLMANVKGGRFVQSLNFPIKNPKTGEEHLPDGERGNWRFSRDTIDKLLANNEIHFGEDGRGRPKLKRFLRDVKEGMTWPTIWDFPPLNTQGSEEIKELFGSVTVFENPKPVGLLMELLRLGSDDTSIVFDFFAGSGSIAHAVMNLNHEDGGQRRFVLAQLPELCPPDSEARRLGFATIADVTTERVRRVIKAFSHGKRQEKTGAAKKGKGSDLFAASSSPTPVSSGLSPRERPPDLGFRVFKLAESNFTPWHADAPKTGEKLAGQMALHVDHIREGRSEQDLLYEVLLKSGFPLTTTVETRVLGGVKVFSIAGGAMLACFDKALTLEAVRAMGDLQPQRVVCLDAGFKENDQLKTNAAQIFKSKGVTSFKTV